MWSIRRLQPQKMASNIWSVENAKQMPKNETVQQSKMDQQIRVVYSSMTRKINWLLTILTICRTFLLRVRGVTIPIACFQGLLYIFFPPSFVDLLLWSLKPKLVCDAFMWSGIVYYGMVIICPVA